VDVLKLIQARQSTRGPFDPGRRISHEDMTKILEAARWAPTAHNMQNFDIMVVDDPGELQVIAALRSSANETFVRENYKQLSFSEEELRRKKVGLLGTMFPAWMRDPNAKQDANGPASFQSGLIPSSAGFLIVTYDPARRAPASEGDFLGVVSLGCVMENMWLMANSLGIAFQVVSVVSSEPAAAQVKELLEIPKDLKIAFAARLGYAAHPSNYLRVRRDVEDFAHGNAFTDRWSPRSPAEM